MSRKSVYLLKRTDIPTELSEFVKCAVVVATTPSAARNKVVLGVPSRIEKKFWRESDDVVIEKLGPALETTDAKVHCMERWRLR